MIQIHLCMHKHIPNVRWKQQKESAEQKKAENRRRTEWKGE